MNKNFIKTSDLDTKSKLMKSGFQLIDETDGIYTFLNSNKISFDKIDKNLKVTYSNMLAI